MTQRLFAALILSLSTLFFSPHRDPSCLQMGHDFDRVFFQKKEKGGRISKRPVTMERERVQYLSAM